MSQSKPSTKQQATQKQDKPKEANQKQNQPAGTKPNQKQSDGNIKEDNDKVDRYISNILYFYFM